MWFDDSFENFLNIDQKLWLTHSLSDLRSIFLLITAKKTILFFLEIKFRLWLSLGDHAFLFIKRRILVFQLFIQITSV